MKNLLILFFSVLSLSVFAQKKQKDIQYYYYEAKSEPSFVSYLEIRKEFDAKKHEFKLPSSNAAVAEIELNRDKILKNERTYAEFLNKYGMKNAGEYASLWFKQLNALKVFLKKNPEFANLTADERQNIIDKWYYSKDKK